MRYKVWRSNKDKELHLLCAEGAETFEALPVSIRNLSSSGFCVEEFQRFQIASLVWIVLDVGLRPLYPVLNMAAIVRRT